LAGKFSGGNVVCGRFVAVAGFQRIGGTGSGSAT